MKMQTKNQQKIKIKQKTLKVEVRKYKNYNKWCFLCYYYYYFICLLYETQ